MDKKKGQKKMKKQLVGLFVLLLLLTAGCAKQNGSVKMDVDSVAGKIMKEVSFKDQMSEIKQKTALSLYGLDGTSVVKAKVYESTGATAEEVAVFEGKDEKSAGKIKEAVMKRIETQKESYKGYVPKELEKLKKPLVDVKGKYVALCVADDTSPAEKVINESAK